MDSTRKAIVRGRIAKIALGLCLILGASARPDIGLHVPGYLADLFVGPAIHGATGLTWALILLAGIALLGAFPGAGFFAALAFVSNLCPRSPALSFLPFVPTFASTLEMGRVTGVIFVQGMNLLLVALVSYVERATARPRSPRAARPTAFHLAVALAGSLLGGLAIALPLGCTTALFRESFDRLVSIRDDLDWLFQLRRVVESIPLSDDALTWLFLAGGALLVSGGIGVVSAWQRLCRIVRGGGARQPTRGRGSALAACLLGGVAAAVPACVFSAVAVAVSLGTSPVSQHVLARIHPWPGPIDIGNYVACLMVLAGAVLIGGVLGVLVAWQRTIRIARAGHKTQESDGIAENATVPEAGVHEAKRQPRFCRRSLLRGALVFGGLAAVSLAAWRDARDPVRHNRHLHNVMAWADRIVVRAGGFDCCRPVEGQKVLFEVVNVDELTDVRDHLQIMPGRPSGGCLCCGFPGIDWYRGNTRLALTSVHHGVRLSWIGFPGDAILTLESHQWLRQWLERHGLNQERLNALERGED